MVVDVDGSAEKHQTSQLIKSIYSDVLHCDMARKPPELLVETVKYIVKPARPPFRRST